ncbi:MAG TPA: M67 family metallopeptidase [Nitrososphaeraceae archaeon]|nr:M67 family metallopeptidase [Nitrososphaeraceae archaeon]
MDSIILSISDYNLTHLERLAKDSIPLECCALLLGKKNSLTNYSVKNIIITNNFSKSSTFFTVHPKDLITFYEKSKSMNLDVISIFHSHPSIPYPSTTDLRYMEINPVIWLIYSTTEFSFKAFLLSEEKKIIEVLINRIKD